jgi:hypothetical protein
MPDGPPWPWERRPAATAGVVVFRCPPGSVVMVSLAEYARRLGRPDSDVWGILQWGVSVGNMRARADGSYDVIAPPDTAPGQR